MPLEELEKSWMAKQNIPSIFISAKERTNIADLRQMVLSAVRQIRDQRYPYAGKR